MSADSCNCNAMVYTTKTCVLLHRQSFDFSHQRPNFRPYLDSNLYSHHQSFYRYTAGTQSPTQSRA